jgi:hypothetical protein
MYRKVQYLKRLQLTDLEIKESLKAAKAVGGYWTAVDFIPSKNREKQPCYFLRSKLITWYRGY